jgi:DNA polymerase IIIc chi subunit
VIQHSIPQRLWGCKPVKFIAHLSVFEVQRNKITPLTLMGSEGNCSRAVVFLSANTRSEAQPILTLVALRQT